MMISLADQIAEVKREIAMRRNVYPKFVASGKMKQTEASLHLDRLEAVLATLLRLQQNESGIKFKEEARNGNV